MDCLFEDYHFNISLYNFLGEHVFVDSKLPGGWTGHGSVTTLCQEPELRRSVGTVYPEVRTRSHGRTIHHPSVGHVCGGVSPGNRTVCV